MDENKVIDLIEIQTENSMNSMERKMVKRIVRKLQNLDLADHDHDQRRVERAGPPARHTAARTAELPHRPPLALPVPAVPLPLSSLAQILLP